MGNTSMLPRPSTRQDPHPRGGGIPIHEPGLLEMVTAQPRRRPLQFTTEAWWQRSTTARCSSSAWSRRPTKTARPT
jgi:hypothetical protein